jgi:DNA-binding transcriptional ArsR family regulator
MEDGRTRSNREAGHQWAHGTTATFRSGSKRSPRNVVVMADAELAATASLIAQPSRATMLRALLDGRALTAGELATIAGISSSTASAHLGTLLDGGLLEVAASGRHRYFRLAGDHVAHLLETLAAASPPAPIRALRESAAARALRPARLCYDHIAGELGVAIHDALVRCDGLVIGADGLSLRPAGEAWLLSAGLDVQTLPATRRPSLRQCLDWTERRFHLAGSIAAALADVLMESRCLERRAPGERGLRITEAGAARLGPLLDGATRPRVSDALASPGLEGTEHDAFDGGAVPDSSR